MDKKAGLKQLFEEFSRIQFPMSSSDNDSLADIHSELVLFDSYIAGSIDKILKNKKNRDIELLYDEILEIRISEFLLKSNRQNAAIAKSYLDYMYRIKMLINEVNLIA